jgi:hypothetical protein
VTSPPYVLLYTAEAQRVIADLEKNAAHRARFKKVRKALRNLQQVGPRHPGLHSHDYQSIPGPGGRTLWESYVENKTPSAWRIWWIYGPGDGEITIVTIGPHP